MEDLGKVFQHACLVQLSTSCWQGSRMLDPAVMEQLGSSEWLKGRKHLVNPETLNPIRAAISRARKEIERNALPFPIAGLTLVPKECLRSTEAVLERHKRDYWEEVERFLEDYAEARETAKESLGEHFNAADYPVDIRGKFGFEWRYLAIETPGKHSILTPEIYERERVKFEAMMEETRELAVAALRQEFADHVSHMVERLTNDPEGKPKVFKASMIEKLRGYIASFEDRNLFADRQLESLVLQAKQIVGGTKAEHIREDPSLKRFIKNEMAQVKEAIDGAIADMPRRKIRFNQAEAA